LKTWRSQQKCCDQKGNGNVLWRGNEAVTADEELKSFPDRQVAVGLVANGNKDF
jgi:hypothetical protein